MEPTNLIWFVGIAAFIGGGVVGAIFYRLIAPAAKNAAKLQSRLEESEQELNEYKAKVTDHFDKTSDLVNELTQDYVKVYKHLAEGAQMLGDPEKTANMLEQQESKTLISFADEESIDPASQEIISEAVRKAAEAVKETSGETSNVESSDDESSPIATEMELETKAEIVSIAEPEKSTESAVTAAELAETDETKGEEIEAPEEIRKSA